MLIGRSGFKPGTFLSLDDCFYHLSHSCRELLNLSIDQMDNISSCGWLSPIISWKYILLMVTDLPVKCSKRVLSNIPQLSQSPVALPWEKLVRSNVKYIVFILFSFGISLKDQKNCISWWKCIWLQIAAIKLLEAFTELQKCESHELQCTLCNSGSRLAETY